MSGDPAGDARHFMFKKYRSDPGRIPAKKKKAGGYRTAGPCASLRLRERNSKAGIEHIEHPDKLRNYRGIP